MTKGEIKIIIPAAGFGTRVGSPLSKELILHENEPMIDHAIRIAKSLHARALIITRKEKTNLIEHLKQFDHVDVQIIEPSKEWPHTILQSEPHWAENNLLILPDTRWSPEYVYLKMLESLNHHKLSVGYFSPEALNTWGCFKLHSYYYTLCEKPQDQLELDYKAWGLLAFHKDIGNELFNLILESTFDHQIKPTHFTYEAFELLNFVDLTR